MASPTEAETEGNGASEYRNGLKHGYGLAMLIYTIGIAFFAFGILAEKEDDGDDDGGDSED